MKKFSVLLALTLTLLGCTMCDSGRWLTIKGTIDPSFDGYNMYFRPQPFPNGDIVDSAKIKGGKFEFKIAADSMYVGDLVLSFSSQTRVEPILIAVEPGTLTATMGIDSYASGTPLNDTLTVWKQFIVDNVQRKTSSELMTAQQLFEKRTVELIKRQPNALGGYLFFLYSPSFSRESVTELDSLKIYQYMPDVTKRPAIKRK